MKKTLFLILMVYTVQTVNAQWAIDPAFGTNGVAHTIVGDGGSSGHSVAIQYDDKVVMVGETNVCQGAVARFNPNGTLDNTFGNNGSVLVPKIGDRDYLLDVVIQSDGKIVATGYSARLTGYDIILVRLNVNGTLDISFGTNGIKIIDINGNPDFAEAIIVQPDGKLVLGGYSGYEFTVVRVNTNGALDATFGTNGVTQTLFDISNCSSITGIALQADGKIVAVGNTVNSINYSKFAVARFNADGTFDNTFGANGKQVFEIGTQFDFLTSVCIQGDGKILLGGHTYRTFGPKYDIAVARLLSNGTLDNTFGTNGVAKNRIVDGANYITEIMLQSDGKIVVAGRTVFDNAVYNFGVARFNTNGTLDNSFHENGVADTDVNSMEAYGEAAVIQHDGGILVAGHAYNASSTSEFVAVRYIDPTIVSVSETETIGNLLSISPNPANNVLKIETKSTCNIDILDVSGKVVFSTVSDSQVLVDVSKLSSGFYFVRAISNNTHEVMKLIIE